MLFCLTAQYTPQALNAMREKPTDRRAAVEQVLAAVEGKLVAMYGKTDGGPGTLSIIDVPDPMAAPAMAGLAVAAGTLQNVQLTRLYTMDEVASIQQKRRQLSSAYKPPGQ